MEEILYELRNKQGLVTSSIKTYLPIDYEKFLENRYVAVLFFILNPRTNEYIEVNRKSIF